jgi:tetratricopeptide (TPR) repeat protein
LAAACPRWDKTNKSEIVKHEYRNRGVSNNIKIQMFRIQNKSRKLIAVAVFVLDFGFVLRIYSYLSDIRDRQSNLGKLLNYCYIVDLYKSFFYNGCMTLKTTENISIGLVLKITTICFLVIVFLSGPINLAGETSKNPHPIYDKKLRELLGKTAYSFQLPDKRPLSIIGTQEEINAGNYYIGSKVTSAANPDSDFFYLAKYQDYLLKELSLSDDRVIDFQEGKTTDYILTWERPGPGIPRKYIAVYKNGELTGSTLYISTNAVLEYDRDGNLKTLQFGTGKNTSTSTYEKEEEEFVLGGETTREWYSFTGRRLARSNYADKNSKPTLVEYDIKYKMNFEISQIKKGGKFEGLPITLDNIVKHNEAIIRSSDGKLSRTITQSNVLGELLGYKTEPVNLNASDCMKEAKELKGKGEYDKAIVQYTRAIAVEPGLVEAWHNRGNCWLEKENCDKAIADYTKVIELNPNISLTYFNRGFSWEIKQDYDRAIADFTRAVQLEPNYAEAFSHRGDNWRYKGEYNKAIDDYTSVIKLKPDDTWALVNRGLCWNKKKEYDRAIEDCTRAIEIDPKNEKSFKERANAWLEKGEYDKTIADCTEVIKINPHHSWALGSRGFAWSKKKDYDRAIDDFNRAIDLDRKDAWTYYQRAFCWKEKRNYDLATADYTSVLEIMPKHADSFKERGNAWLNKKLYDKAISDYSSFLEINPKDSWVYGQRGYAWVQKGEYDKAAADYTEAIKINPNYTWAYGGRGHCWRMKKEYDNAIADLTRSIDMNSNDPWIYSERGLAWEMKAEYEKAVADHTRAIELNPGFAGNYSNRALALEKAGDLKKALDDAKKALNLQPDNETFKKQVLRLENLLKTP